MSFYEIRGVTIAQKGQIAIPKKPWDRSGFKIESKVVLLAYEDRLELRPIDQIGEGIAGAIASEKVLAKDWNSEEDEKNMEKPMKGSVVAVPFPSSDL